MDADVDGDADADSDAAREVSVAIVDRDMEEEDEEQEPAYHASPKYRRAVIYAPHEDVDVPQTESYMDNNYNCEYKCKERNMRAIRCSRQQQQQHQHHHLHPHPHSSLHHPHAHSLPHQVATAPQTALNLGRHHGNAIVAATAAESLCVAEAAYSPTHTATPTASSIYREPPQQQQHQQQPHLSYASPNGELAHSYAAHHAHHPPPHTAAHTPTLPSPHYQPSSSVLASLSPPPPSTSTGSGSSTSAAAAAAAAAAANRRDHNIDYSTLFVQLSGTLPTLYRCVSCNKIVSNRWHHANIHRPQSHECPVCGQKFTRRDNMKAHCKIKHADIKDRFFSHYVHM